MNLNTFDILIIYILFLFSFLIKSWKIYFPDSLVFDEYHFGDFINQYYSKTFYFDIHPPFSKLLYYFFSILWNYNKSINFNIPIGTKFNNSNYYFFRLFNSVISTFSILFFYIILIINKKKQFFSIFISLLLLFETSILLEKIQQDKDSKSDWTNVADHINKALIDPRFELIPTEIIYQILSIADKKLLKPIFLIHFVLSMLEKKPESAIPLILRLDFDQMTPEEIDKIFDCTLVHELNINFFTIASLSALANREQISIQNNEKRHLIELQSLEYHIKKINETNIFESNKKNNEEIEEINDEIQRQQEIIDKLYERIFEHKNRMDIAENKQKTRRIPIDPIDLEEMQNAINNEINDMTEEVNSALEEHQVKMIDFEAESATAADSFFNKNIQYGETEISKIKAHIKFLTKAETKLNDKVKMISNDLTDVKSILCAKVVRDKLRFDQFLRRTANRFKLFDKEPKYWGLNSIIVKDAEEYLKNIDQKLDDYCPIRAQTKQEKMENFE